MNLREQRGKEIATTRAIRKKGGFYLVPSQAGTCLYQVSITAESESCTCPDYQTRQQTCKHLFALAYYMMRELNPDGTETVTEVTVTATKRKTYPQNWKAYNAAQVEEQDRFQVLLHDLCRNLPVAPAKRGRQPLPLSDAVFIAAFKVYSTVSQRRFMSDLRESHERQFISKVPHFNSISNALENPDLTPILKTLIAESSLPLKSVETNFAADSSGFTTSRFIRWFDHKYGKPRQRHEWVSVHVMTGVKTNVITAVEVGERYSGDSPNFIPMLKATAENFQIGEVSADTAYCSDKNAAAVVNAGGTPFMTFRVDATGERGPYYKQMFHYFNFKRDEYLQHYHRRSNVESTFSAIKRKFSDSLRSRTDTAMKNEALCKILCHNLVVLIHEIHELGIDPVFWQEKNSCTPNVKAAHQMPLLPE
jgi:transposase